MRKGVLIILGFLFILSVLQLTEISSTLSGFFSSFPWWLYFVLAGIIYSGYKTMQLTAEERKVDQIHIEEEGRVYVERMEDERKRRKQATDN
ncbi:sporulation YhaL family protein [Pseudalkalibacillus hwajinpoensis]|uniref:sporulation YhaL family protein n=1 Tax=Guptibacillus hwajinpoensis TaxID=208199 RepID=UPI0023EECB93|nr:sporulation YhaL family protein [Pseudalkalibacillus hwajinpoensis]